ncbi:migration and invasion-inhibitory protein [Periophthalmus magnuspinnatus]|uniref:migration and invasion-inhibitory protein n=1 Tax=Periophthalmus magnuspinnatus TaxID=409849 RepID=UPI00145BFD09|nr:migration and invasion-inhibitory protein [Periophthalmus magnuspinnatus]
MSSADRVNVLRERNKALMAHLQQQREKFKEAGSGGLQSRKRDREDGTEESCEAGEVWTVTDGNQGSARAALARPKVTFSDAIEHSPPVQTSTMESELTTDDVRCTSVSPRSKSSTKGQQSEEAQSSIGRHHLTPLLGYDWIAGVIDAEDSLMERSDDFFNDLCRFRALNREQCVNSRHSGFSEESDATLPSVSDTIPDIKKDTHQCTFSYRINNRLFPVPLISEECCPVCKKHKSEHPHTAKEPALIRVSIPRSTLLPPHKYKAHRRCSFDPSDSLSLPSHCLSGWSNKGQSAETSQSNLDLRSSLDTKREAENKELEDLSAFKTSDQQRSHQIPQVSLLSRHNFPHFSIRKRKQRF